MSTTPHRPAFSLFPLLLMAVAFATGVAISQTGATRLAPAVGLGTLSLAIAFVAFHKQRIALASTLLFFSFACAGSMLSLIERRNIAEDRVRRMLERGEISAAEPLEITGVLERAPEIAPDGLVLTLRAEKIRKRDQERSATGRIELFAPAGDTRARRTYAVLELRRGARVRVMTALARAERFRNPGVTSLNEILEQRELDARGSIKSALLIERLDDEPVFLPVAQLEEWRIALVRFFDERFSEDTSGVLKASLVGNRHGLSRASAERFREGGTFHVLVISGMHITLVGGVMLIVARRLIPGAARQWLIAVGAVWSYAIFAGAEPSVVRAALMFTVVTLAPVLGRRSSSLNALGGAAMILLIWRPSNLFDPSFQLTFLSVFAIVSLALPLLEKLKEVGQWHPTRMTPYPPSCPRWFIALGESLFWSERRGRQEMTRLSHSYRLFKLPLAGVLDRCRLQRPLRYIFAAMLVSVVVQLTLLPLLVFYFHRISLAAPLLNVYVGVLMVVVSFFAIVATVFSEVSVVATELFVWSTEKASWLMAHGVDPFETRGLASIRVAEYSGAAAIVYGIYFLPIVMLAIFLNRWSPIANTPRSDDGHARAFQRRLLRVTIDAFCALFVLVVFHPFAAGRPDGRLHLDFLDVGQGDATLITMPDGTTLLVDGGGSPRFDGGPRIAQAEQSGPFERDGRSIGERVVSEYLWWRGLKRVDYVLATHADSDHIDGLNDIVRNFAVDAALVARAPARDKEFRRLVASTERGGTPIFLVARGDVLQFGAVTVEVLWPPEVEDEAHGKSENDDSIVLRVRHGRRTFILTGDIEKRAENRLVSMEDLQCDAIKVAHHGSLTSSTEAFVDETRPALAIISVGLDSPYGHPHPDVVGRWRRRGAEVITTGERGMISISTNGDDLKVETVVSP